MSTGQYNGQISKLQRTESLICPAPEEELLEAALNNDLHKIERLIRSHYYLLNYRYILKGNKTILLIACSEDEIKASTVAILLKLGANRREREHLSEYEALHCAAQKTDYETLEELLERNSESIINSPAKGQNALHILIRYGNADSEDFVKCAELLIKKGINVNQTNINNKTPLDFARKKNQKKMVELLENSNNSLLSSKHSSPLGPKEILISYLKENLEDNFVKFNDGNIKEFANENDSYSTLLQISCQKGLINAVQHLLDQEAIPNLTFENKEKPLEIAADHGYTNIVTVLLKNGAEITTEILCSTLKNIDDICHDYKGCYQELMKEICKKESDEILLLLNQKDSNNNTPLHYAVRYASSDIVEDLLNLGASLGAKNKQGIMPIEDMEPEMLEKHLDNCVKFDLKNKKCEKEDFQVTFDYRSLVPPYVKYKYEKDYNSITMNNLESDLESGSLKEKNESTLKKVLVAETEVIFFMSNASEYKHLLKHPVIVSFLFMKWHRLQWLFRTNLAFYAAFVSSLVLYVFTDYAYFNSDEKPIILNFIAKISYGVLVITLIILMLREIFQICVAPTKYFKNFENYLEIILISITAVIVFSDSSYNVRKQLASVAILLSAFELVLMLGQHPHFSTNVVMLKTVSFNFFKFLLWYSILLIAFALSFYLLFTTAPEEEIKNDKLEISIVKKNETSENKDDEDKSFENPMKSVFKTIIMLTGEFDAGSINFETFPITSKLVFALFIFMIAIILLNLLNGLAVSDTQMIKNDAELVGHIARARHIRYVETMLLGNILPINFIERLNDFCCWFPVPQNRQYIIGRSLAQDACLFPKYLNYEIVFYPNQYGCVQLSGDHNKNFNKSCLSCSEIYLDRETVKRTQNIIHAKRENEENDIKKITGEIELLKEKMDSILKILRGEIS